MQGVHRALTKLRDVFMREFCSLLDPFKYSVSIIFKQYPSDPTGPKYVLVVYFGPQSRYSDICGHRPRVLSDGVMLFSGAQRHVAPHRGGMPLLFPTRSRWQEPQTRGTLTKLLILLMIEILRDFLQKMYQNLRG